MALPLLSSSAWAQGPVLGTVLDARTGTALPGATILLDGTASAATDATGTFSLSAVPAGPHELRVSFLGYETLLRRLQGQATEQRLSTTLQPGAYSPAKPS
ncbi:carboxypeptidase-like regulatory domain-containing protein [Hymenobacter volaticus]|uniref:Carboxypeptidase-like regulatory domain-containing protein n=1 Tax=Hymenobacter volaticus TaxID=2932254 RepID=A0ABY4G4U2_9BACT|nr:carboxypeptidase-like regulatory domain-containing protein [Hymenobacter volaticus]